MLNLERLNHARLVCAGLGCLFVAGLRADDLSGPTPATSGATVTHLTDAQDRVLTKGLSPQADTLSRATALYAEAMLLRDGSTSDQKLALEKFRQVVALDPHCADASIRIASLLLQTGQIDPALEQVKTAFAANPDSIPLESTLGCLYRMRGNNDEAFRLSRHALAQDPSQSNSMRILLEIAADSNQLAPGVRQIEDLLRTKGKSIAASTWVTLARLYLEVSRTCSPPIPSDVVLQTRLGMLQEAIAKPPPDGETLSLLADIYHDLDRKSEALKALLRASALDPSNVDLILRCARVQAEVGQKTEALHSYERAYALNPSLNGMRELLGRLYLDAKRYDDAVPLLQEAHADAPLNADLGIALGVAYEATHHPEQAKDCLNQIFALPSCPPEAYVNLALFQLQEEQVDDAAITLAQGQERFPKSAKIRFYQAVQNRYAKKYTEALTALDQVRALAVGVDAAILDPAYYAESALILNLAGQKNRIEETLREGLGKYPDSADLLNELAYFWADERTHLPEARSLVERAARLAPNNGPILDTQGWIYFQMGEVKDALPYLQRAALLTNNDPVVLQHMGDAYFKLGLRSEAIAVWRRALAQDPHNHDLANRIDAALAQANNAQLRSALRP